MAQVYAKRLMLGESKLRAASALQAAGESVNGYEPVQFLLTACTRRFGPRYVGESSTEYFNRCGDLSPKPRTKYRGEIVRPFIVDLMKRPEWHPHPHLRAAEIDALPRQIGTTGSGIGNRTNWNHLDR